MASYLGILVIVTDGNLASFEFENVTGVFTGHRVDGTVGTVLGHQYPYCRAREHGS